MPARPGPGLLLVAAVVSLFALMTLGNVVSATGSGLACPDWPLCHGRLIPPLRPDVLIEYSHRVVAAVTAVLVVAAVLAVMRRGGSPRTRRVGLALLALLGVQVLLGGVTVLFELPDLVSTAHLVAALLILAGLVWLSTEPRAGTPAKVMRLARAGVWVLLAQLAIGGYVRHAGAGLACPDFPLCSGDLVPGHWLGVVHFVHRWLGVALLGLFGHLALTCRQSPLARLARLSVVLAAGQVILGVLAVVLGLPPAVRAGHAAVGYALWGVTVWAAVAAGAFGDSPPETLRGGVPMTGATTR